MIHNLMESRYKIDLIIYMSIVLKMHFIKYRSVLNLLCAYVVLNKVGARHLERLLLDIQ